jgi:Uma2 family endonuclease
MATAATLRIGPADHGRAMTLEEFRDVDEEPGYRYELARGVLEATEVPNDPHGQVEWNILRAFARYAEEHPGVIQRSGGSGSFRLWLPGMISGRNPDVAVVLKGAPWDVRGRRVPALAVEIVSAGGEARDYVTKREEYLAYGLFEYWIVDPQAKKVTVLARDGGVWRERVFQGDQAVESVLLPDFATRVAEFWSEAEGEDGVGGTDQNETS